MISTRISLCARIVTVCWWTAASLAAQPSPPLWVQVVDDFSGGSGGWLPEFSDYAFGTGDLRRNAEVRELPADVAVEGSAYFLQSVNRSDDLFMFLKKVVGPADGIEPGASYQVEYLVEFGSNAPSGCAGVGGAPGESVVVKIGASAIEPVPILGEQGLRLNLDKGEQTEDGLDAVVAGDVANGLPCENDSQKPFVLLERRATMPQPVKASEHGELWLFFGTDSGYEGLTQLYYSRVAVLLTRVAGGVQ